MAIDTQLMAFIVSGGAAGMEAAETTIDGPLGAALLTERRRRE